MPIQNPDSLSQSLAREFACGLTEAGHEYRLLDLYAEGFDPVLRAGELPGPAQALTEEVRRMQERVRAADGLVFVYPLWWGAPPAVLQGWLQRVFTYGFAFEFNKGAPQGLLRHRAQVLLTAGGTTHSDPTAPLVESLQFCGMQMVKEPGVPRNRAGNRPGRRGKCPEDGARGREVILRYCFN
ncbi:MAG: NAD(P)H-dependent oxidoreductase [Comamonadaceae bacterium]|nr:NAD(P)H-dependent oxidoreductase [Comamonadaceae bacterium]